MNVIQYLSEEGIDYKPVGNNEVVITCPGCGKKKLSININTGLFRCFTCEATDESSTFANGHISVIQKHLGHIILSLLLKILLKELIKKKLILMIW